MKPKTGHRDAIIDITVVGGVCLAYVLLESLHVPKRWSFLAMGVALALYAVYLVRRRTDSWYELGFRTDNLRRGLFPAIACTAVGAVALLGVGLWEKRTAWGPEAVQVLVTAAAFASVHFGNRVLTGLTFTAGLCWSALYRRWPNLWLLAASHSILAALAYPLVLADAPLSRF